MPKKETHFLVRCGLSNAMAMKYRIVLVKYFNKKTVHDMAPNTYDFSHVFVIFTTQQRTSKIAYNTCNQLNNFVTAQKCLTDRRLISKWFPTFKVKMFMSLQMKSTNAVSIFPSYILFIALELSFRICLLKHRRISLHLRTSRYQHILRHKFCQTQRPFLRG